MIRPPPLPASPPRAATAPEVHPDEVVAVDDDEAEEISGDDVVEAEASPESEHGEIETADDAVLDAEPEDELPAPLPSDPQPQPVSRLEAWFAQLVHGYCPPDGVQFARSTTTATVQPQSPGQQSFPTGSDGG